jgi:hypothetical protein
MWGNHSSKEGNNFGGSAMFIFSHVTVVDKKDGKKNGSVDVMEEMHLSNHGYSPWDGFFLLER